MMLAKAYDFACGSELSGDTATSGGGGVVLECVDYCNYSPAICAAIAESLTGELSK